MLLELYAPGVSLCGERDVLLVVSENCPLPSLLKPQAPLGILYPMAMASRPLRFSEGSSTPATSLYIRTVCLRSRFSDYSLFLPVPCGSLSAPPPGRGAGLLRGALWGPRSDRPRVAPSLISPRNPAVPTLPAPPGVPAPPGLSLRAPWVQPPSAAYPSATSSRSSSSRRWAMVPRLLRRLAGLRKCGPAPPRPGPSPSRPGPVQPLPAQPLPAQPCSHRRPGAPRPEGRHPPSAEAAGAPRLPAVSGAAPILLTLRFIAGIIYTLL